MKVHVEGDGVFGSFLKEQLQPYVTLDNSADIVILAVPFAAYDEVAAKFENKHLVNICSVQKESTDACLRHSDRVTSIHPMFGPRSPVEGRTSVLTHSGEESVHIISLFSNISKIISMFKGQPINPAIHDEFMAKTHLQVVKLSDIIARIAKDAEDIPDELLPTSFKRLKALSEQFLDMPEGTKSSILSNTFKGIL